MFGRFPRRYQAGSLVPLGVHNRQQNPVDYPRRNHTLFAISGINIETVRSKNVIENELSGFESDPMLVQI